MQSHNSLVTKSKKNKKNPPIATLEFLEVQKLIDM